MRILTCSVIAVCTVAASGCATNDAAPTASETASVAPVVAGTVPRGDAIVGPDAVTVVAPGAARGSIRDPIAALRDIHDQLARAGPAASWRDRIVPGSSLADRPLAWLVPRSPRHYRLQSDDGARANVFVESPSGRSVVTLVRWNGAWRLAAVVSLVDRPPLVVIAASR